jgi:hypothetical protein
VIRLADVEEAVDVVKGLGHAYDCRVFKTDRTGSGGWCSCGKQKITDWLRRFVLQMKREEKPK